MTVRFGNGKTQYGPGVLVTLDGVELATAIYSYLMAHNVIIDGACTIKVNGEICYSATAYIDPSGRAIVGGIGWNGRGYKE